MRYENRQELRDKIDWEGGLESFLRYGFDVEDISEEDEELYSIASDMVWKWDEYMTLAEKFTDLLPEY